jgi:methionyl-tRNA synthetase
VRHKKKVLITSALPYANGALHFGHIAGAYLPGDCYARFRRLLGDDVLYVCGSDEHGVAITLSADLAGRSPKEHVDLFHAINQELFHKLNFSFDHYSRTTWEGHAKTTQEFFLVLQEKGLIEAKVENHLYSEKENKFLADRYVVGTCPKCGFDGARGDECQKCAASYEATDLKNPRSKLTGSPLVLRPSEHLYLRFDLFKEQLKEWIGKKDWKENVVRFAMSYIDDLKMRAITRDSDWGIPVPLYKDKVFYVWFDAPIGYISATQEWAQKMGKPDLWKDYWLDPETKLVQFIGKDNIPFHAVFFPAMLMGQNLPYKLPDELPANEFFLLEGRQFSKSDGWTIDLESFFAKYSPDQARYAIAANAPETADAEFSWKDFQMRCNAELLGKLGNFVHRVLTFAKQHCASQVPPCETLQEIDREFLTNIERCVQEANHAYNGFHLRKATQIIMELAQLGNAYFEHKKPWSLVKTGEKGALQATIYCGIQAIRSLALISSPIIPASAQKIWEQLGYKTPLEKENWAHVQGTQVPSGQHLPEPFVIFRKVEDVEIDLQIQQLHASLKEITLKTDTLVEKPMIFEPLKAAIGIDQFDRIDLRVGTVLEATNIPKSKKLLKLTVDLGFEKRTIVSGIALHYQAEQMVGKKVLVVANLTPVTLMGVESHGMILAAHDTALELPLLQAVASGSTVS